MELAQMAVEFEHGAVIDNNVQLTVRQPGDDLRWKIARAFAVASKCAFPAPSDDISDARDAGETANQFALPQAHRSDPKVAATGACAMASP
jgi:hypothetical protein